MGTNLESTQSGVQEYKKSIFIMGEMLVYRFIRFWLHPPFLFNLTPKAREQNKILKHLHQFTTNVIKERRKGRVLSGDKFVAEDHIKDDDTINKKKRLAMLDLLLSAEADGNIDENGIREEVDTFMFEVSCEIIFHICIKNNQIFLYKIITVHFLFNETKFESVFHKYSK